MFTRAFYMCYVMFTRAFYMCYDPIYACVLEPTLAENHVFPKRTKWKQIRFTAKNAVITHSVNAAIKSKKKTQSENGRANSPLDLALSSLNKLISFQLKGQKYL